MTTTTHTPGPWYHDAETDEVHCKDGVVCSMDHARLGGFDFEENAANAALIAAAWSAARSAEYTWMAQTLLKLLREAT